MYKKINLSFFIKLIFFLVFICFILFRFLSFKIFNTNEVLIDYMMNDSNHLVTSDYSYYDKINDLIFLVTHHNFSVPVSLFEDKYFFYDEVIDNSLDTEDVFNDDNNENKLIDNSNDDNNENKLIDNSNDDNNENKLIDNSNDDNLPNSISEPLVYIYNTHQSEEYLLNDSFNSNLVPTVYTASLILKDELEKKGIGVLVSDADITSYLHDNGLNYDDSYVASRYFLEDVVKKNNSIKLFIDLHRDALDHDSSTVNNGDMAFSKILFVVGMDYEGYQGNLDLANHLNDLFLEKYPFLTRGVMKKSGPLVNGVYNQDLGPNIILLEVGGNESYIDEVSNSIMLISDVIFNYLEEIK